jgi:5-methylcytosine-specific restriction endonuclease McrA|tara:strand:+ start:126 stop:362 length:237 start_codon:yes stop_codon:yes gene_type:complete
MPFTVSGRVTDYALNRHDIPKRDRRFSLSYSQDAGWDDPDSLVLAALRAEAATLDNLQTLCSRCNQGKGNRYNTDWRH